MNIKVLPSVFWQQNWHHVEIIEVYFYYLQMMSTSLTKRASSIALSVLIFVKKTL